MRKKIMEPRYPISVRAAAQLLERKECTIAAWIEREGVATVAVGKRRCIDAEGFAELEYLLNGRLCEVCGQTFSPWTFTSRFCSPRCENKAYDRMRNEKLLILRPTGWYADLVVALKDRVSPGDEVWLTQLEAVEIGGLTGMQIRFLGKRGILRIAPHPTKYCRGKPVRLYAQSEIVLAGEVFRKFQAKS